MVPMSRVFTRQEFHALVWSKPLTQLAKDFQLSDVALHKICRKHDIPNPPLGWWAKKAAGKAVRQVPLPRAKAGTVDRITIAGGELRPERAVIASARENARVLASSLEADALAPSNPIVERTAKRLRAAKPSALTGLVAVEGAGLIKAEIAPGSIDRFEVALNRIIAAAEALGTQLVDGEKAAVLLHGEEMIGFSVNEPTKREKHVLTEEELAEQEAWRRKRERYWAKSKNSWDDLDFDISGPRLPEWDYRATGKLSFELEQSYLDASVRRSFRDAKIQRLENLATDIAVGIAVVAAAKRDDRLRREEEARRRHEERHRRELVLRARHIEERRGAALDAVLEEVASLDRLRRMVDGLRGQQAPGSGGRLAELLLFAEQRLASREAALSGEGLAQRFEVQRLFGDDDDHDFKPPHYYS